MDYQKQLMDLINQCQDTWVRLQSNNDKNSARSRKDLRMAIKQLVQLQDDFDDLPTMGDVSSWEKKALALTNQVTQQVNTIQKAMELKQTGMNDKDALDQMALEDRSIDLQTASLKNDFDDKLSNALTQPPSAHSPIETITPNSLFNRSPPLSSSSMPWLSKLQEDEVYDLPRRSFDRSEPSSPSEDDSSSIATITTTSSDLYPTVLSKSSNNLNIYLLQQQPDIPRQLMQVNLTPSNMTVLSPETRAGKERRSKLSLSLPFKKLNSSYSSPVPGGSTLAQINFYKDSGEDNGTRSFAADAIVDHPLRIGAGYGSYICYSCTVISNKGTPITIRKRYSDFVHIRQQLIKLYPNKMISTLPKLPPKKIVKKFDPVFVEQRRRELEYFFRYIVLHPTFGSCTVVKQWIAP